MKAPRSLKACKNDDEIEKYILSNDGLSDSDLEGLEPVEVGPSDKVGQIIPLLLDPVTLVNLQKIARKKRKLFTTLIREWVVERSRRELLKERKGEPNSKKAAGGRG